MTNNNYTLLSKSDYVAMTNIELIHVISELKKKHGIWLLSKLKSQYNGLLDELNERTSFLDDNKNYPISARIYCLKHNITE